MAKVVICESLDNRARKLQSFLRMQIAAFLLATLLLTWRCVLFRNIREPWAEDATDILPVALSTPWNLLQPVVDVVLLTGRLFGLAAVSISVEFAPALLSIFSILFYSYITSYFCRPGFSWLVPNDRVRFLAAVSFALVPGTAEVVGNAACVMYTIAVWAIFLLLERPHAKGIIPKWILILLSTPLALITIPLLALLYIVRRERLYLTLLALNGLSLLSLIVLRKLSDHPASPGELRLSWQFLKVFEVLYAGMLAPLLGAPEVQAVADSPLLVGSVLPVIFFVLFKSLRCVPRDVAAVMVGLLAAVPMYHGVHALGRVYGYDSLALSNALLLISRWSFFTVLFPMVFWFVLLSNASNGLSPMVSRLILAAIIVINSLLFFVVARDIRAERRAEWSRFQEWLSRARKSEGMIGSKAQLPVFVHPELWATLDCIREELAIVCQVTGGNGGKEVYALPVEVGARRGER